MTRDWKTVAISAFPNIFTTAFSLFIFFCNCALNLLSRNPYKLSPNSTPLVGTNADDLEPIPVSILWPSYKFPPGWEDTGVMDDFLPCDALLLMLLLTPRLLTFYPAGLVTLSGNIFYLYVCLNYERALLIDSVSLNSITGSCVLTSFNR